MKIDVTVGEISVMGQPLLDLMAVKLSGKLSYEAARLIQQLANEVTIVEAARIAIIQQHGGVQDKLTGGWTLEPLNPQYKEAVTKLNEMMAETVTIECDPIVLPAKVVLAPHILIVLSKFVTVAGTSPLVSKKL